MKTHTQAADRQPVTSGHGNAIDCRPITSVQPDGIWIARYPWTLELLAGRTDYQARRGLNERPTRRVPDSANARARHRTLDDELAATADEQVKRALRSLIHHRKHVVLQSLQRIGSR